MAVTWFRSQQVGQHPKSGRAGWWPWVGNEGIVWCPAAPQPRWSMLTLGLYPSRCRQRRLPHIPWSGVWTVSGSGTVEVARRLAPCPRVLFAFFLQRACPNPSATAVVAERLFPPPCIQQRRRLPRLLCAPSRIAIRATPTPPSSGRPELLLHVIVLRVSRNLPRLKPPTDEPSHRRLLPRAGQQDSLGRLRQIGGAGASARERREVSYHHGPRDAVPPPSWR